MKCKIIFLACTGFKVHSMVSSLFHVNPHSCDRRTQKPVLNNFQVQMSSTKHMLKCIFYNYI